MKNVTRNTLSSKNLSTSLSQNILSKHIKLEEEKNEKIEEKEKDLNLEEKVKELNLEK